MKVRRSWRCPKGGECDLYVLDSDRDYCRKCTRIVHVRAESSEAAASPEVIVVIEGHNHSADGLPSYPVFRNACPKGCDIARAGEIAANTGRPNLLVVDPIREAYAAAAVRGDLPAESSEAAASPDDCSCNAPFSTAGHTASCDAYIRRGEAAQLAAEAVRAVEGDATLGSRCRTEDHVGQITQLGEMVDAARKETVCPRHPDRSLSMCVVCVTEAASQGDERLREAIHERSGVLEYVESERRLVWTDRTGPREYGASAIVAENVLPWFGRMLRAALDREAGR